MGDTLALFTATQEDLAGDASTFGSA